ncbi:MAG: phosphatidate cytidylyltransferase [Desulfurivibrio sp.]|nr:MAG: phosphatidate cytidylyltransferase [Desulfurivibrio sp.]
MKRIITGLLAVAAWLALLSSHSYPLFWLVITVISLLAANEFFAICLQHEERPLRPLLVAISLLPVAVTWLQRIDLVHAAFIATLMLLAVLAVFTAARLEKPFDLLLKASFGAMYTGLFTAHLILFMALPAGASWLLFLTTITAASDTGAYFTGMSLGRHKLCPSISPKKTVEGLAGGMLCGTGFALLVAFFLFDEVHLGRLAAAALFLSALGVVGDLVESLLKRSMGVKDSGAILPGHGGILDRADSLLLTAPVLYYLVTYHLLG